MELDLLGEAVNDTQGTYRLLKSLPSDYGTFVEIHRNQKEIPTLAEVTEKLLAEEQSRGHRQHTVDRRLDVTAMAAQKMKKEPGGCHYCGKCEAIGKGNVGRDAKTPRTKGTTGK
eukprot:CAMPEP_0113961154 /NCGR_PEP_ID=MMETSP0011_2-20120614/5136_1 /TAXON_ID=101924 /ORGANISM="Rhodosorus marinus" /LENGTH=114 /DNA_ID=CAMNT_0000972733 /DNA_START=286 /DNA_END=630 /DNA_ORIENTATION=+ /assembly_acc=CAM_ASM_000156